VVARVAVGQQVGSVVWCGTNVSSGSFFLTCIADTAVAAVSVTQTQEWCCCILKALTSLPAAACDPVTLRLRQVDDVEALECC